jgi:predicted metal-dependent enzyme (double-stranded beta helix superfamily)
MIRAFKELGDQVLANWKSLGERHEQFSEIATTALRESHILETIEPDEIIEWLGASADIPEQFARESTQEFGQPPVNVYVANKFYIQALFWIDGTTAIHEHAFSGAFGVLSGASVHSRYNFQLGNRLSPEVQVGNISFVSSELLKRGDIHTIEVGENFIHALFHLDRPSVSIVVRTRSQTDRQFRYLKPYIAYDTCFDDKRFLTKLRMLESLRIFDPDRFWNYAALLLEHGGAWMLLHVLIIAFQRSAENPDRWKELLEKASQQHSHHVVDSIEASIREESRVKKLTRLRSVIYESDLRFFLALLLNVPSREALLALVAERFRTSEPEALVAEWIRQMSDRGLFRSKTDPVLLDTIKLAMRYRSFDEARLSWEGHKDIEQVELEKMKQMWDVAHASEFLQPLFR